MPDRRAELERAIGQLLNEVKDPCSVAAETPTGLVDMGLVEAITVSDQGEVRIDLRLTTPTCNMLGFLAEEASSRVRQLPGVTAVEVVADQGLDWHPGLMSLKAQAQRRERLHLLQIHTRR